MVIERVHERGLFGGHGSELEGKVVAAVGNQVVWGQARLQELMAQDLEGEVPLTVYRGAPEDLPRSLEGPPRMSRTSRYRMNRAVMAEVRGWRQEGGDPEPPPGEALPGARAAGEPGGDAAPAPGAEDPAENPRDPRADHGEAPPPGGGGGPLGEDEVAQEDRENAPPPMEIDGEARGGPSAAPARGALAPGGDAPAAPANPVEPGAGAPGPQAGQEAAPRGEEADPRGAPGMGPARAPPGHHAAQGFRQLAFPDWLSLRHVPETPGDLLSPERHPEQRARYLRELGEARRGISHFRLGTGEGEQDDHGRYLEWELGPHWDRGLWGGALGTDAALRVRMVLRDSRGRWWRGSAPPPGH